MLWGGLNDYLKLLREYAEMKIRQDHGIQNADMIGMVLNKVGNYILLSSNEYGVIENERENRNMPAPIRVRDLIKNPYYQDTRNIFSEIEKNGSINREFIENRTDVIQKFIRSKWEKSQMI